MLGRDVYLGISQVSHLKTAEFQRSPILGVLLYLCLHTLTQNDQIRFKVTHMGRGCFLRSATPLYLHKCIARFVSEAEFLVVTHCSFSTLSITCSNQTNILVRFIRMIPCRTMHTGRILSRAYAAIRDLELITM